MTVTMCAALKCFVAKRVIAPMVSSVLRGPGAGGGPEVCPADGRGPGAFLLAVGSPRAPNLPRSRSSNRWATLSPETEISIPSGDQHQG
jgi:hypothetical protein